MENSFVVSGFVGKDASIHQFSTASVARFPLAISRTEKSGEETIRTSAFINVEAWRKNENTTSFDRLVKGATPHGWRLFQAGGVAGCRRCQAQQSGICSHQVLWSCWKGGNSSSSGEELQEGQVKPFFSPIERPSGRFFMLILLFAEIRSSYTDFGELA